MTSKIYPLYIFDKSAFFYKSQIFVEELQESFTVSGFKVSIMTKGKAIKSDSENAKDEQPRRKRCYRHTLHQIHNLEEFYKECPHPSDKQRKELSRELGMEQLQVKFWFQNKRNQMKTQHEHKENSMLRIENEKLHNENMRYKEVLNNATCPNCGSPAIVAKMSLDELQLRSENARLKQEIDRISIVAANYVGKPFGNSSA